MKLRDLDGNVTYPTILDNRGNNIIDSVKGIKSQLNILTSQINALTSQKNEVTSIKSQMSKIYSDINYLTTWTRGNTTNETLQILTTSTGKPYIEIVSGGFWTRAAVTYVNLTVKPISGVWSTSQKVCSGFPEPVVETALVIYVNPYNINKAKIDDTGCLIIGPDFSNGTTFNIAGCYANKNS